MTGGTAIILGSIGNNFAAGMTGGMVFVYDPKDVFENKANPDSIIWQKLENDYWTVLKTNSLKTCLSLKFSR